MTRYIRYLLLAVLLLASSLARAQALDRIDVEMRENEADMVIRFVHSVVYLRHAPQAEAKLLRIFVRITDPFVHESELMQTTVRSPKLDRVPGMVAVYPELVNGILVTFSQKTTYTVRPGDDEKSVIVTVPLLPAPTVPVAKSAKPGRPEQPAGDSIVAGAAQTTPAQPASVAAATPAPQPSAVAVPVVKAPPEPAPAPIPASTSAPATPTQEPLPIRPAASAESAKPGASAEPTAGSSRSITPETLTRPPTLVEMPLPAPPISTAKPATPARPEQPSVESALAKPSQPTPLQTAPIASTTPASEPSAIAQPVAKAVPEPAPLPASTPALAAMKTPTTPAPESFPITPAASAELPAISSKLIAPATLARPPLNVEASAPVTVLAAPQEPASRSQQRQAESSPVASPGVEVLNQNPQLAPPPSIPGDADNVERDVELPRTVTASGKISPMATRPTTTRTAMTAQEVDERARSLVDGARTSLANGDPVKAIDQLNDVLRLSINSQTEPAQALIGEARELNGEFVKAKAEYELYLKLYPAGASAPAVRKHLAELPKDAATARAVQKPLPKEAGPSEWTFFSSVSSYYYTGNSQIDTLTPPAPGQIVSNRESLSLVDQRSLITSVNLNARRRDAFSDTRIVVRDTKNDDHLNSTRSYNRLYSAYIDHNDRKYGYYIRAGRQNPNGMGVLERFDGAQAGYNLSPDWRVNAVYGDAVEFGSDYKKTFYGASVDFLPQTGRPGVSAYMIDQTLNGYANRRAIGSEARYFDGRFSSFGMLDYDVLYKGVNIAMAQGNFVSDAGTNYYFVADHRRAPSYSLTNALPAGGGMSLDQMVQLQGLDAVRSQAEALTAISDMYSIGFTHPVTEQWQLGADYRISSISSTQPVKAVVPLADIGVCLGTIDPVNNTCIIDTTGQNGSGWSQVFSLQAIGTNLIKSNAVGVLNGSYIAAPTYDGYMGSFSYMLPFSESWRLDTNLRYYMQSSNNGDMLRRTNPSIKLSYQWQSSMFIEGEAGWENSTLTGSQRDEKTKRQYVYVGLRWDYR